MNKISDNKQLVISWLIISFFGSMIIFSSSYKINASNGYAPYATVLPHVVIILLMMVILVIIYKYRKQMYNLLFKTINFQFYFSLVSLIIVLLLKIIATNFGIDSLSRGGAYQVIPLFVIDFQPLELYKITTILYFALKVGKGKGNKSFNQIVVHIALIMIGIILILLQPDTGGAFIVLAVLCFLIFINQQYVWKLIKIFLVLVFAGLSLMFISNQLSSSNLDDGSNYKSERLQAYIDPFENIESSGANIVNSALAISNGGVTGTGYLNSTQSSGYLFASYSDFIFAVICEQFGIFGAVITILLLLFITYKCFTIARGAHTRVGELYCYGYGFLILFQSAINIGGVVGVIPLTGVTLPFISNGINSYVFLTLGLFYVVIIDLEAKRQQRIYDERANSLFM